MPLTPSESLVAGLCRSSFLTLWSEPNPVTRPGKELCDLLVVCGPEIVILSVKEVALKDTGAPEIDWTRWQRRAIEDSVKQVYGAERWLRQTARVIRADGSPGLSLPPPTKARYHRIAVALGGRGEVPLQQGDFGKGYVHVLDEIALQAVLGELDTISDFVEYLVAKEAIVYAGSGPVMIGQEEDLLAFYLHQGRRFPVTHEVLVVGDGLWTDLIQKPEWRARKEADQESYVWDGLIETLRELHDDSGASRTEALDTLDGALRVMAREGRFERRILAHAFNEFMRDAAALRTRARIAPSPSGVSYVFLATGREEGREMRRRELQLRCFVSRGRQVVGDTVVGIATERYRRGAGFSLDAVRLAIPTWTEDDQRAVEGIQRDLGYFANPVESRTHLDEFPQPKEA